jgi:flagellar basal-body rod protein FlgC
MSTFSIFEIAGMGMSAQNLRLNTIASNIANADTVGKNEKETYREKLPVFQNVNLNNDDMEMAAINGVKVVSVVDSTKPLISKYEPSHPHADENGYIYKSNVSIVEAMADMISASKTYQTNAQLISTAKELMHQTINLGK